MILNSDSDSDSNNYYYYEYHICHWPNDHLLKHSSAVSRSRLIPPDEEKQLWPNMNVFKNAPKQWNTSSKDCRDVSAHQFSVLQHAACSRPLKRAIWDFGWDNCWKTLKFVFYLRTPPLDPELPLLEVPRESGLRFWKSKIHRSTIHFLFGFILHSLKLIFFVVSQPVEYFCTVIFYVRHLVCNHA